MLFCWNFTLFYHAPAPKFHGILEKLFFFIIILILGLTSSNTLMKWERSVMWYARWMAMDQLWWSGAKQCEQDNLTVYQADLWVCLEGLKQIPFSDWFCSSVDATMFVWSDTCLSALINKHKICWTRNKRGNLIYCSPCVFVPLQMFMYVHCYYPTPANCPNI